MDLYREKVRNIAIHAALSDVYKNNKSNDFMTIKIAYKWILVEIIAEMQREIHKINNNLEL